MRPFFAVAISALVPTVPGPAVGSDQDGWSDNCYAQLTMRQVQTRDYSYEVLQNCEIVPRTARGSFAPPDAAAAPSAPSAALKSERERPRKRRPARGTRS